MTAIALETKSASELENKLEGKLKEMYEGVFRGEKSTMVRLFALLYADELEQLNSAARKRIADNATKTNSYNVELGKMIKLSQYVEVKSHTQKEFILNHSNRN